jgi:outer membrane protein OmpA-like peptidoglycan-associated protein
MGGFDFYVARREANGSFGVGTNLGYPINTPYDERSLVISADGTTGYFASTNIKGYGKYDLYSFELPEASRPKVVTYLKGIIADSKTKKPVQADFELIDVATNEVIVKSTSDRVNGQFLVSLPSDRQYALIVSSDGYLFHSESFNLTGEHPLLEPYLVDIALQKITVDDPVVLKNIFFDTDKYDLKKESYAELNKLVELLKNNPKLKIEISGHTDNQGSKTHNQELSQNRAKAVYDYLAANGIATTRLTYKGYGDTQPIDTNDTDQGRANNRRTEFKVTAVQ